MTTVLLILLSPIIGVFVLFTFFFIMGILLTPILLILEYKSEKYLKKIDVKKED